MGLRTGGVAGDFDGLFLVFCREMDDEIQATLPEEVGIPLERAPGRIGIQGKKEEGTERSRAEGSPLHFLFLCGSGGVVDVDVGREEGTLLCPRGTRDALLTLPAQCAPLPVPTVVWGG